MSQAREPHTIIADAEKAAAAGDYPAAETLLREVARVQEASLGPLHPDLANTLNNLGVVCEITGKPADAEQCFRRALAIATAALDDGHPFISTSRQNLRDFCEARGIPVEVETTAPETKPLDPQLESKRLFVRFAFGALGPIAALMIVLAAGLPRLNSPQLVEFRPTPVDPPTVVPPVVANVAVEPVVTPPLEMSSNPERPKVVEANLCATLDDWLCDPADRPVEPGPLFFYTRVVSTNDTTVQHRWYRDNRLDYIVDLRILASPIGYRAFSRNRMSNESAGNWRVEVWSEDGTLIEQERFTVR